MNTPIVIDRTKSEVRDAILHAIRQGLSSEEHDHVAERLTEGDLDHIADMAIRGIESTNVRFKKERVAAYGVRATGAW